MNYIHIIGKGLPREYLGTITTSEWLEFGYDIGPLSSTGWKIDEEDVRIISKEKLGLSDFGWIVPKEEFLKFMITLELRKEVEK